MEPRRVDPKRVVSPESALASDIFDRFCSANTLKSILNQYRQLCNVVRIKPTHFPDFYPRLKAKLSSWRAQALWSKFEKRASSRCYGRGKACYGSRVLIIGGGPCGLRTAIEAQLLGAKVVVVEKRDRFSRNNVLHLWPFVITDLKGLGAKKFYGKFCAGSIDHISIRQLQCILLKVALLLGVEVHEGVSFEGLKEPSETNYEGWKAVTSPADHPVSHYTFDVLIGADGRRNTLDGFRRKELRAKLAIAITANFINKHTEAEARVKEISGVSYIFNQKFFQDLNEDTGINLENIVYYKDETHYFVMTAKKQSLLMKGVLRHDYADTAKLLSHENINKDQLVNYALEAARYSTEYQLTDLEFAVNHYGKPDVAMFDFTAMYAAENACKVIQRKGYKLLMALVGDSLLEPFWPTGSGCARGFLSCFDATWMIRSWCNSNRSVLEVIAERESIYRLLGQTTPENLNKEPISYTIDPHSRYPNLNLRAVMPFQVKSLYDSDEIIPEICEDGNPTEIDKVPKKRRRDPVIAADLLLAWLRDQVSCYGIEFVDVADVFNRGDVLCAIIHRFRPDLIEFPLPSEENVSPYDTAEFRNQVAYDLLQSEYTLAPPSSQSDYLGLVAYLSQIYEIFRGEIPQIKFARVDSSEELDEQEIQRQRSSHYKYNFGSAHSSKHNNSSRVKSSSRKSRLSSSGRSDSREGDTTESLSRKKKRRSEERLNRAPEKDNSGREIRTTLEGGLSGSSGCLTDDRNVPGLARDLEAKLRGSKSQPKKPKDLLRAVGKIEKSDWNVQKIEQKIAESKGYVPPGNDRDDKVPKWSREAFDDKREAMKRKMEGIGACSSEKASKNDNLQTFEENVKTLEKKLKDGNVLDVGQRGCNKVSQMASKLVTKLEKPKDPEPIVPKPASQRPFEFPKKDGSERCHFCKERVYLVEKMTAEGKFFHKRCFKCEYCNTSLRVGNYAFEREGRYGERFFCPPHYHLVRMAGWKKFDELEDINDGAASDIRLLTPTSQILSEMDERGTTPERVEFENSVDFSEEDLLDEIDEDEWTDRNFGASNADNNDNHTSDEASDLSEDDEITPEGSKNHRFENLTDPEELSHDSTGSDKKVKDTDSSDSNTEVGDEEEDEEEEDDEDDEDEDDEDEEDECGGSTTEIETDSEFAEDPPHSVPGQIPKIVVNEPEHVVSRIVDAGQVHPKPEIEPVNLRNHPERVMPRVNTIPKKWEPLPRNPQPTGPKMALELKKNYLHGGVPISSLLTKPNKDPAAQKQFRNVFDKISEQQKLLQPAAKPSATMTAFLESADKLKQKNTVSPVMESSFKIEIEPKVLSSLDNNEDNRNKEDTTLEMNRLNLVKAMEASVEKSDLEKDKITSELSLSPINGSSSANEEPMNISSTPSLSQSESQSTIIAATAFENDPIKIPDDRSSSNDVDDEEDSGTDGPLSDSDHICDEDVKLAVKREPPRVEIEDEFGITLSLDLPEALNNKNVGSTNNNNARNRTPVDNDFRKAIVGMSSSDSKDSLNSGVFLETELSDWTRDGVDEDKGGISNSPMTPQKLKNKKKTVRKKVIERNAKREQQGREDQDLHLELDEMDFMDVDAVSSPEDHIRNFTRKQGYCKLASEDEEEPRLESITPEPETKAVTNDKAESSTTPSTSTTPTVDSVSRPCEKKNEMTPVEAINPVLLSKEPKVPVLDRVVPFSKARDSLDYRKGMKGISTLSKDLYSEFMASSSTDSEKNTPAPKPVQTLTEDKMAPSSTSPVTARKLEAIQKERVMQSDLIKSMVLGRIRQSPEKSVRRSSRGSESPVGSSKGYKSESQDSRRSSQNSILSSSQDGDEERCTSSSPVTESNNSSNNNVERSGGVTSSIEPHIMSESGTTTSTSDNNANVSAHSTKPLLSSPVKADETTSPSQLYEPVFTSSPRFRNRPKFESPFSAASVTNPNTPVSPLDHSKDVFSCPSKYKTAKGKKSPSFYQSMPDLSVFGARRHEDDSTSDEGEAKRYQFTTPSVKRWEVFKSVEREKARREARERARLKSDEELGLSPTDYAKLKDRVCRRGSVPDSDDNSVFCSPSPRVASSVPSTPTRGTLPVRQVMLLKPGMDFSGTKGGDPFLVPGAQGRGSNRRLSPEKAKSTGYEPNSPCSSNKSPYVDSNWLLTKSRENTFRPRANTVSDLKKYTDDYPRMEPVTPPVPTVPSPGNQKLMHVHVPASTSVVAPSDRLYSNSGNHRQHNTGFGGPYSGNGTNHNVHKVSKALSSDTLLEDYSACPHGGSSSLIGSEPLKTLSGGRSVPDIVSTSKLMCDSNSSINNGINDNHSGNSERRKSGGSGKKSKDRDRRRSLIQTGFANVIGLFNRSGSNNGGSGSGTPEKVNTSMSPSPSKEKFSLFKLTPKFKDRRKSKEALTSPEMKTPTSGLQDAMTIQSLKASPTPGSMLGRRVGGEDCTNVDDMATLSIIASPKGSTDDPVTQEKIKKAERDKARHIRQREMQNIKLKLDQIDLDQRILKDTVEKLERKMMSTTQTDTQDELMVEWMQTYRERSALARLEREYLMRYDKLDLQERKENLEDLLDQCLQCDDRLKSPDQKNAEGEIVKKIQTVEERRAALLAKFEEDMRQYDEKDAEMEAQLAISNFSPKESNV